MKESIEELKKKKWKLVQSDNTHCANCDLIESEHCIEISHGICKSKTHFIVKEDK